jgi:hypothetical protein
MLALVTAVGSRRDWQPSEHPPNLELVSVNLSAVCWAPHVQHAIRVGQRHGEFLG